MPVVTGAEVDVVEGGGGERPLAQDVDDLAVQVGDGGEVGMPDDDVLGEEPFSGLAEEDVLGEQSGVPEGAVPHRGGGVADLGAGGVDPLVAVPVGRADEGGAGHAVLAPQEVLALGELGDDRAVAQRGESGVRPRVVAELDLPGFHQGQHLGAVVRPGGVGAGDEEGEADTGVLGEVEVGVDDGGVGAVVDGDRHDVADPVGQPGDHAVRGNGGGQ